MLEKWVLSMVGIVAVSVLLDIIVPEGESNKYIKGVFSIMTICIMIAPLPELISTIKGGSVRVPTYSEEIVVDDVLLSDINSSKLGVIESNIEELLERSGGSRADVTIIGGDNDKVIDKIIVSVGGLDEYKVKQLILHNIKLDVKEVEVIDGG